MISCHISFLSSRQIERGINMLIIMVVFIALIVSSSNIRIRGFHEDYISKEHSGMIEGIFVVFVFFRHFSQHAVATDYFSTSFKAINSYVGQLLVIPFLFFTGYGTMLSIRNKGTDYVKRLPVKFLNLLIRFDICVLLFCLFNLVTNKAYPLRTILLSFTSWKSIGNSNWYVTAILLFYIFVFLAHFLSGKKEVLTILFVSIMIAIYMFLCIKLKRGVYSYNTMMILPLGMLYCIIENKLFRYLKCHQYAYICLLGVSVALYALLSSYRSKNIFIYVLWIFTFLFSFILLLMKVRINSYLFGFLGRHVFSIYILQRLSFMLLQEFGIKYNFDQFIGSFAITLVIAVLFDKVIPYIQLGRKKMIISGPIRKIHDI